MSAQGAAPVFSGAAVGVVTIETEASTGLEAIYVVRSTEGLTISVDGDSESAVWYRFGASGAGYAEEIARGATLSNPAGGYGYFYRIGNRDTYFWLIDYSQVEMTATALSVESSDCDELTLTFDGNASQIAAYAINGRRIEVDREIELSYYNLVETDDRFVQQEVTKQYAYLGREIHADAPLCTTRFTLSPDRFQRQWGEGTTLYSESVAPTAVKAIATATIEGRENANEQDGTDNQTAVSAPLTVEFHAEITDAAIFGEWQIATDSDFDDITLRDQSTDFRYTFTSAGTFYVRFAAANASGSCEYFTDTWSTTIGESRLRCPNAFSPGTSEGVNDVWCVSYRSITEFDCSIFNRWGNLLFHSTDPATGWDGRYKGKLVEPGVYFYVIKARGADGVSYNLSGDINIIRSR